MDAADRLLRLPLPPIHIRINPNVNNVATRAKVPTPNVMLLGTPAMRVAGASVKGLVIDGTVTRLGLGFCRFNLIFQAACPEPRSRIGRCRHEATQPSWVSDETAVGLWPTVQVSAKRHVC
jgi:hypothetical protein